MIASFIKKPKFISHQITTVIFVDSNNNDSNLGKMLNQRSATLSLLAQFADRYFTYLDATFINFFIILSITLPEVPYAKIQKLKTIWKDSGSVLSSVYKINVMSVTVELPF